ncbi:hypothetical protein BDL97_18G077500 [Sphagnum fallax]|nr:hypothetical protein BDL97_18G077500 [Sphagnum fallax]KAH8934334.1 hypothetical protein BDL97_18G077500 [Sphagnum fallax]
MAYHERWFAMQAIFTAVWILFCLKVAHESMVLMNVSTRDKFFLEVYLYYNPVFLTALMVWLWGINIYVFLNARIPYAKVFELEHIHLTHHEIWKVASWMTVAVITSMTAYLYLYSRGMVFHAASQPILLYVMVPLVLGLPLDVFHMQTRFYFLRTLVRLIFPIQPISFSDFFLADVLTSMAKVLSDLERSVCRMYHWQVATVAWLEPGDTCGSHSIHIPVVLALPYVIRFIQCMRQYHDTKDKTCLANALKYFSTFPVILLSAMKYHVLQEFWEGWLRPLWLVFAVLNSCYCFYWDIRKDWDIGCLSGPCRPRKQCLRPILLYNRPGVYYWAIGSNLVMRGAWTYKLSAHLRHNFRTVFFFSFLEMCRRFQWIFFRVEIAAIKLSNSGGALPRVTSQIPLKDLSGDTEHLITASE